MPPPSCKAYPIAILLHDYCAIYNPPTNPLVYAIHHTILTIAISCKGQISVNIYIYIYIYICIYICIDRYRYRVNLSCAVGSVVQRIESEAKAKAERALAAAGRYVTQLKTTMNVATPEQLYR